MKTGRSFESMVRLVVFFLAATYVLAKFDKDIRDKSAYPANGELTPVPSWDSGESGKPVEISGGYESGEFTERKRNSSARSPKFTERNDSSSLKAFLENVLRAQDEFKWIDQAVRDGKSVRRNPRNNDYEYSSVSSNVKEPSEVDGHYEVRFRGKRDYDRNSETIWMPEKNRCQDSHDSPETVYLKEDATMEKDFGPRNSENFKRSEFTGTPDSELTSFNVESPPNDSSIASLIRANDLVPLKESRTATKQGKSGSIQSSPQSFESLKHTILELKKTLTNEKTREKAKDRGVSKINRQNRNGAKERKEIRENDKYERSVSRRVNEGDKNSEERGDGFDNEIKERPAELETYEENVDRKTWGSQRIKDNEYQNEGDFRLFHRAGFGESFLERKIREEQHGRVRRSEEENVLALRANFSSDFKDEDAKHSLTNESVESRGKTSKSFFVNSSSDVASTNESSTDRKNVAENSVEFRNTSGYLRESPKEFTENSSSLVKNNSYGNGGIENLRGQGEIEKKLIERILEKLDETTAKDSAYKEKESREESPRNQLQSINSTETNGGTDEEKIVEIGRRKSEPKANVDFAQGDRPMRTHEREVESYQNPKSTKGMERGDGSEERHVKPSDRELSERKSEKTNDSPGRSESLKPIENSLGNLEGNRILKNLGESVDNGFNEDSVKPGRLVANALRVEKKLLVRMDEKPAKLISTVFDVKIQRAEVADLGKNDSGNKVKSEENQSLKNEEKYRDKSDGDGDDNDNRMTEVSFRDIGKYSEKENALVNKNNETNEKEQSIKITRIKDASLDKDARRNVGNLEESIDDENEGNSMVKEDSDDDAIESMLNKIERNGMTRKLLWSSSASSSSENQSERSQVKKEIDKRHSVQNDNKCIKLNQNPVKTPVEEGSKKENNLIKTQENDLQKKISNGLLATNLSVPNNRFESMNSVRSNSRFIPDDLLQSSTSKNTRSKRLVKTEESKRETAGHPVLSANAVATKEKRSLANDKENSARAKVNVLIKQRMSSKKKSDREYVRRKRQPMGTIEYYDYDGEDQQAQIVSNERKRSHDSVETKAGSFNGTEACKSEESAEKKNEHKEAIEKLEREREKLGNKGPKEEFVVGKSQGKNETEKNGKTYNSEDGKKVTIKNEGRQDEVEKIEDENRRSDELRGAIDRGVTSLEANSRNRWSDETKETSEVGEVSKGEKSLENRVGKIIFDEPFEYILNLHGKLQPETIDDLLENVSPSKLSGEKESENSKDLYESHREKDIKNSEEAGLLSSSHEEARKEYDESDGESKSRSRLRDDQRMYHEMNDRFQTGNSELASVDDKLREKYSGQSDSQDGNYVGRESELLSGDRNKVSVGQMQAEVYTLGTAMDSPLFPTGNDSTKSQMERTYVIISSAQLPGSNTSDLRSNILTLRITDDSIKVLGEQRDSTEGKNVATTAEWKALPRGRDYPFLQTGLANEASKKRVNPKRDSESPYENKGYLEPQIRRENNRQEVEHGNQVAFQSKDLQESFVEPLNWEDDFNNDVKIRLGRGLKSTQDLNDDRNLNILQRADVNVESIRTRPTNETQEINRLNETVESKFYDDDKSSKNSSYRNIKRENDETMNRKIKPSEKFVRIAADGEKNSGVPGNYINTEKLEITERNLILSERNESETNILTEANSYRSAPNENGIKPFNASENFPEFPQDVFTVESTGIETSRYVRTPYHDNLQYPLSELGINPSRMRDDFRFKREAEFSPKFYEDSTRNEENRYPENSNHARYFNDQKFNHSPKQNYLISPSWRDQLKRDNYDAESWERHKNFREKKSPRKRDKSKKKKKRKNVKKGKRKHHARSSKRHDKKGNIDKHSGHNANRNRRHKHRSNISKVSDKNENSLEPIKKNKVKDSSLIHGVHKVQKSRGDTSKSELLAGNNEQFDEFDGITGNKEFKKSNFIENDEPNTMKPSDGGKREISILLTTDNMNDESQMDLALHGELAGKIVEKIFEQVEKNEKLKSVLGPGLRRENKPKDVITADRTYRQGLDEDEIKHTEAMMKRIMELLGRLILDEVQRKTCVSLPPDMRDYLQWMLEMDREDGSFEGRLNRKGESSMNKAHRSESEFLFEGNHETKTDVNELYKKVKVLEKLIDEYKSLSEREKTRVQTVRDYLVKELDSLLKYIEMKEKEEKIVPVSKIGAAKGLLTADTRRRTIRSSDKTIRHRDESRKRHKHKQKRSKQRHDELTPEYRKLARQAAMLRRKRANIQEYSRTLNDLEYEQSKTYDSTIDLDVGSRKRKRDLSNNEDKEINVLIDSEKEAGNLKNDESDSRGRRHRFYNAKNSVAENPTERNLNLNTDESGYDSRNFDEESSFGLNDYLKNYSKRKREVPRMKVLSAARDENMKSDDSNGIKVDLQTKKGIQSSEPRSSTDEKHVARKSLVSNESQPLNGDEYGKSEGNKRNNSVGVIKITVKSLDSPIRSREDSCEHCLIKVKNNSNTNDGINNDNINNKNHNESSENYEDPLKTIERKINVYPDKSYPDNNSSISNNERKIPEKEGKSVVKNIQFANGETREKVCTINCVKEASESNESNKSNESQYSRKVEKTKVEGKVDSENPEVVLSNLKHSKFRSYNPHNNFDFARKWEDQFYDDNDRFDNTRNFDDGNAHFPEYRTRFYHPDAIYYYPFLPHYNHEDLPHFLPIIPDFFSRHRRYPVVGHLEYDPFKERQLDLKRRNGRLDGYRWRNAEDRLISGFKRNDLTNEHRASIDNTSDGTAPSEKEGTN